MRLTMTNRAGFTIEFWMKTAPVANAYTLVGKGRDDFYYYYSDYALKLLPSGGLRATIIDTNKNQWTTQTVPMAHEVDDDQWHFMALVCDRTSNTTTIYVDGVSSCQLDSSGKFWPGAKLRKPVPRRYPCLL